jgi:DNA polymerase-3 subunit epsilon
MKYFYYDLETTGLHHWKHGIHQLSGLLEIDGQIVDTINLRVQPNPKAIIDDEALKVGGISREALKTFTPFKDGYKYLTYTLGKYCDKFDKKDKFHLVGYNNSSFDNAFLRAFFVQNNDKYFNSWFWIDTIDVMVLASNHLKKQRHLMTDFKLSTVAKKLKIKVDEESLHDANYDIEITRQIFKKISK